MAEKLTTVWVYTNRDPRKPLCIHCPNYNADDRSCEITPKKCTAGNNMIWVREVDWVALKLDGL